MKTLSLDQQDHIIDAIDFASNEKKDYLSFRQVRKRLFRNFKVTKIANIHQKDYALACRFLGVFPRKSLLNAQIHPIKAVSSPSMDDLSIEDIIKQLGIHVSTVNKLYIKLLKQLSENQGMVH